MLISSSHHLPPSQILEFLFWSLPPEDHGLCSQFLMQLQWLHPTEEQQKLIMRMQGKNLKVLKSSTLQHSREDHLLTCPGVMNRLVVNSSSGQGMVSL